MNNYVYVFQNQLTTYDNIMFVKKNRLPIFMGLTVCKFSSMINVC